jgi:AraC-like DNA-binding protein
MNPNSLENRPKVRVARSRLPGSWFRTHDLPPEERFAAWRESVGVFLQTRLAPQDDPTLFNGDVESYLLGDIVLSRPRANRQKFDRPSGRIARDGLDSYMIQLFVRGNTEISLGRRSVRGPERKIIGFDLGDTLDSHNDDFDILAVLVPRARLAPLLTHPDSLHTAILSTEEGGGGLLANFLPNLFDSLPDLALSQSETAGRALVELIATAFNGATFAEGDAPQIAHRALVLKAKSFVKAQLESPTLDPEQVAAAMGLSRSALYRLFKESGGIAFYIREQRLRCCFADVVSHRKRDAQIASVAFRWGFRDAALFSRLFKERFGCTPSEARAGAGAAVGQNKRPLDARVGDRRYEDWIAGLA